MDSPHRTAEEWAAAVDELWHADDRDDVLGEASATGVVAGVALCRERIRTNEDVNTVLISADGDWTVLLDPAIGCWRALPGRASGRVRTEVGVGHAYGPVGQLPDGHQRTTGKRVIQYVNGRMRWLRPLLGRTTAQTASPTTAESYSPSTIFLDAPKVSERAAKR